MKDTQKDYRESHKYKGKGQEYEESFFKSNYKNFIYKWETEVLTSYFKDFEGRSYLDFACGTGRITRLAENYIEDITGIDVSESMVNVAREKSKNIKYIIIDITRDKNMELGKYDLVTAFRFFTNAQENLRKEVFNSLLDLMHKDSIFIFNIHMNSKSPYALLARFYEMIFGKREGFNHIDIDYMDKVLGLKKHFTIEKVYSKGVIPIIREEKEYPKWVFNFLAKAEKLLSLIPGYSTHSKYQIIICKKN